MGLPVLSRDIETGLDIADDADDDVLVARW